MFFDIRFHVAFAVFYDSIIQAALKAVGPLRWYQHLGGPNPHHGDPMAKAKNRIAEAEDRALETIYQDMMGTMDLLEILGASTLGIETICQTQHLMPALRSVAKQIYDRVSQHGAHLEMIQQNRAGEVKRIGGA
jgi:hypothetical protein